MPLTITHEIPFTEQQYLPLLGHLVIGHDLGPIAQLPDSINFSLSLMHKIFTVHLKTLL